MSLQQIPQALYAFMRTHEFTRCVYYAHIGSLALGDDVDMYDLEGFTPGTDFYRLWREIEYILLDAKLCSFEMKDGEAHKINTTQKTYFLDNDSTSHS